MMSQVYRGRTLAEARSAAEEELGPDAILLTTRRIKRSGISGAFGNTDVEVCATSPRNVLGPAEPPAAFKPKASPFSAFAHRIETPPNQNDLIALRAEVRTEMRALKSLVAKQSSHPALENELCALRAAMERMASPEPKNSRESRALRMAGIEGPAATAVLRALKSSKKTESSLEDQLRDAVADVVMPTAWPLADTGRSIIALVGPSGVGKTTTAAKLAAHAAFELQRSVSLISCDRFRVGAVEQLSRYANLIGADFDCAESQEELGERLTETRADVVFVDTAGQGHGDREGIESCLAKLLPAVSRGATVHILLCLPAALRAVDAERFARIFMPAEPTSIVITKLDETPAPGGLVHGTHATRLPVSTLCFGPRVPEDITPATSGRMLDYLVPRNAHGHSE